MARVNLNLPDKLMQATRKYAESQGSSVTAIIREALKDRLTKVLAEEQQLPEDIRYTP